MYYKARMYDPALGRFLQTDPAGYSAGMNLYAYVMNNYANGSDPTGLCEAGEITVDAQGVESVCAPGVKPGDECLMLDTAISDRNGRRCPNEVDLGWAVPGAPGVFMLGGTETVVSSANRLRGGTGGGGGTNNQPKNLQACVNNLLQNKFGNFVANWVIPEFSLLSLADSSRRLAFAEGAAVSAGTKLGAAGGAQLYGSSLIWRGASIEGIPGLEGASAAFIRSGAAWVAGGSIAGGVIVGVGIAGTTFATGAELWARQQCSRSQ
jgi:hypothetical protein